MNERFISSLVLAARLGSGIGGGTAALSDDFSAHLPSMPPASADAALKIAREGSRIRLTFTGVLERAESLAGPWLALTNVPSPILVEPAGPHYFYRTPLAEPSSIFSSEAIITMQLSGPLQKNFELAFAGTPDGIFPPHRQKDYFDALLAVETKPIPVKLKVRGNSSLQECPFPKLKFKVSSENRSGTPFADAREVKIGTHCAEGGRGNIGRLRDARATYREALAYETMNILGFITPRLRRAEIEYRDTTAPSQSPAGGWELARKALILEDIEVLAERLGGRALDDEEISALSGAHFEEQLVTDLELLHALLGNWDYSLSQDGTGLHNIDVIEMANHQLVPVAGDFDLASLVTGTVRLSVPIDFHPDWPDVERQMRYTLEQLQQRAKPAQFAAGRTRFLASRTALEARGHTADIDEEGRSNALRHVAAFFDSLDALEHR